MSDVVLKQPAAAYSAADERPEHTWRPLALLNAYRIVLATLFFGLMQAADPPYPLASDNPRLFLFVSFFWFAFAVACLVTASQRLFPFRVQLYTQITVDILAVTLLMHASGGVDSGLGMLLVVTVANAAMISAGRTAGLFAALATIAVLLEEAYTHLLRPGADLSYPHAGLLGATLFATAVLAHVLARRARESEQLAAQRGVDLANMAQLTGFIIEQMQTGVLALDGNDRVMFANDASKRLLGTPEEDARHLMQLSRDLSQRLGRWRLNQEEGRPLRSVDGGQELLPRFVPIGPHGAAGTLVFLEDASQAARQAQQLKLASLGRLTASIAHEVRNPLGAISHAGQLLAESPALAGGDRRLVEIVLNQAQRVNTIVENVLQLGRRDRSRPQPLAIGPWLQQQAAGFTQTHELAADSVAVSVTPADLEVVFDPSHLEQIVGNLLENAERHTRESPQRPRIRLSATHGRHDRVVLEVHDVGAGIREAQQERLFEPFFTTERAGTGLGLYISRELAQCNRAELQYVPGGQGCTFRLLFPSPRA